MADQTVTFTQFEANAGHYVDRAGKAPLLITKYGRPVCVLLDIEEFARLMARDTRQAYYAHELPDAAIAALEASDFSHIDPSLDLLMD